MTKKIGACPECGGSRVQRQSSPRGFDDKPNYGCHDCGAKFDELVYRNAKRERFHLGDSLAAKLDAMDAEEVGP